MSRVCVCVCLCRASPQVFLDTVTLSLPLSDYLALLAAAMRGPAWKTGAVTTAPLMNGIDAFELQPGFVPTTSTTSIPVKAYQVRSNAQRHTHKHTHRHARARTREWIQKTHG